MKPDPQKLDAVKKSDSKKDVRSFLGLAGYYRRFMPHFATILEPLTALTSTNYAPKVKCSTKCEEAFCKLKLHYQLSDGCRFEAA